LIDSTAGQTAGEITDFLWKPRADGGFNNGLLVVLVSACDAQVLVNGTELIDFGPSNGRCTTARSLSTTGCGFGSNIRVEVIARQSGLPYRFPSGETFFTIPNGCNRTEFKF
jgi:hypothetical protein